MILLILSNPRGRPTHLNGLPQQGSSGRVWVSTKVGTHSVYWLEYCGRVTKVCLDPPLRLCVDPHNLTLSRNEEKVIVAFHHFNKPNQMRLFGANGAELDDKPWPRDIDRPLVWKKPPKSVQSQPWLYLLNIDSGGLTRVGEALALPSAAVLLDAFEASLP